MAVVSGGQPVGGSGCDTRNGAPTQKGDALCFASGGFTVEAQLTNVGPISGQVNGVQTVIAWTAGLLGPGDAGSTKAVSAVNCPGIPVTAAPVPFLFPHTAAVGCTAVPPPLTNAQATAVIGRFEFNCGPDPNQEQVAMVVVPALPQEATHITNASNAPFADKDGTEIITIICNGPVGGIAELPEVADTPLGTDEPSGFSAALLAGLIAGASAGAIAVAGTAWYSRRRLAR